MTLPAWLDDIGAYLQTQGIGTLGTDIFYRGFEASALNCIALFDQAGPGSIVSASGDMTLYRPELGIRVRNSSDIAADAKAREIYNLLHIKTNFVSGSTHFKRIKAIAEPFFVSQSKTDLFIYSINFSIEISGE